MKRCVFAGDRFDPFTIGHDDTVKKCLTLFDEVVIAIAENRRKHCMFSLEERLAMVRETYKEEPRVRVLAWDGVIVDLLKKENTRFYVRGLRNTVDFEYENADFYASRDLDKEMITLYLPCEKEHLHISSTLVKNLHFVREAVFAIRPGGSLLLHHKKRIIYVQKTGTHPSPEELHGEMPLPPALGRDQKGARPGSRWTSSRGARTSSSSSSVPAPRTRAHPCSNMCGA